MSSASSSPIAFVAGRYLLRERIGAGAAGEIWSAEDPRIGRTVAVKFLRIPEGLGAAPRAEWESRFLLEARAAGRLSHPGIVSIHDVGTASDGRPFIVMELVEGRSLDEVLHAEERPPVEQVAAWTIEVARALDAAHRGGVIHRDVKPANILIGDDGRARIADFGIARVAESELTRDGTFVGSPAFAAPEQLCGAKVDGRADVFSLAAVFYLLAVGRRPFEGQDIPSVVYSVCHVEPQPPGLSPAIDAVILRALAKSPEERFPAAADFADALAAAVSLPERAPEVDSAEARAGSIGSAAAVAIVRGTRAAVRVVRAWVLRVEARRWWQLAGLAALLLGGVLVVSALRDDRQEHGRPPVLERIKAAVAPRTSRVNVTIEDPLPGATFEIREGGRLLLKDSMGSPSGPSFKLPAGTHELSLAVVGPKGLAVERSLDVDVESRSEYELRLSVARWPWKRLGVDWDRVSE